jgi:hypothetical protein
MGMGISDIGGWDTTHINKVCMLMKLDSSGSFHHQVTDVPICSDGSCGQLTTLQSSSAKYLISICLVHLVGACTSTMKTAPALSMCYCVGVDCGIPRSWSKERKRTIFPVSAAATNLASALERATAFW